MKIDVTKLGYKWKGAYSSTATYQPRDVVRKDGKMQYFTGTGWESMLEDQQHANVRGELLSPGNLTTLAGVRDQELYVQAAGGLEFRFGDGRKSTAAVRLPENNHMDCNSWGGAQAYAIMSDGTVKCWGRQSHGIGDGVVANQHRSLPSIVGFPPGTPPIVKIFTGWYNAYALDANGQLWAWGYNNYGQLGIGNTTSQGVPVLVSGKGDLPLNAKVVDVKTGNGYYGYYCALIRTEDGRVYHTGAQQYYSAGTRDGGVQHNTPKLVPKSLEINVADMFIVGHYHGGSWLLDTQGRLYGAGEQNTIGRIHNNDNPDVMHELWAPSETHPVKFIVAEESDEHVNAGAQYYRQYMIVHTDGRIRSWGHGSEYSSGADRIGDPNSPNGTETWVPKLDTRISGVVSAVVTAGWYATAHVLKSDGTVWGIGSGQDGVGGVPNTWTQIYPTILTNGVKLFGGGARHGKQLGMLTADGRWYAWGMNEYGTSGNGNTANDASGGPALMPKEIKQVYYFGEVSDSAAATTVLALTDDGNVYSWGYNGYAQLGRDDDQEVSYTPSPVIL